MAGRENSFTFDFSVLAGFSGTGGGKAGGGIDEDDETDDCEGRPGDDCPDLGKTMFAAAVAARVWLPTRPL